MIRETLVRTRLFIAAGALALALAPTQAQAAPERYEIDPEHTAAGFLVMHANFARVLGLFREVSGSFDFDEEARDISDLRIVIGTDSVYTAHERRDRHLRSPDFLNSREFPEMIFVGTETEKLSDTHGKIHGELTLLGRTNPVTLDVTFNRVGTHPFGGHYAVGASARGSFDRSDFGMTYALQNEGVGDRVELLIEVEAIRQ